MKSYEEIAQVGTEEIHWILAERALCSYGLGGAALDLLSDAEHMSFRVTAPAQGPCAVHPYLGRIAGEQFVLRIHEEVEGFAALYSEMVYLLALCRDTELTVPEPVPGLSGELVVELEGEHSLAGLHLCVLLRWVEDASEDIDLREQGLVKTSATVSTTRGRRDSFAAPAGLTRPTWDYERLLAD